MWIFLLAIKCYCTFCCQYIQRINRQLMCFHSCSWKLKNERKKYGCFADRYVSVSSLHVPNQSDFGLRTLLQRNPKSLEGRRLAWNLLVVPHRGTCVCGTISWLTPSAGYSQDSVGGDNQTLVLDVKDVLLRRDPVYSLASSWNVFDMVTRSIPSPCQVR